MAPSIATGIGGEQQRGGYKGWAWASCAQALFGDGARARAAR